ncbi:MAG: diacylglycerol/lipid kinase family protein [Gemmatimonadaceae bacterium]
MNRKHIVFVVHGARAGRPDFQHLVHWVRGKGHRVEVRPTWEEGDAAFHAGAAADEGCDVVVAAGGDGTLNEVVNGLDGRDTPLGVVPLGTANDFAKQLGIPADADHAMDVVLQRPALRVDTGSLNGRRFVNVSSGGMGAEATAETPTDAKASLGSFAYAITGIRKLAALAPYHARFIGDDFEFEGEFLVFAVGNARATGAGTLLAPHASPVDGQLDVCVVESMPRREFARLVLRMKKGGHVAQPGVHYARVSRLRIQAEVPLTVNVDGEAMTLSHLEYRARAVDLRVHARHLPGEE